VTLSAIANGIKEIDEDIVLIYAFNSVGKTQLSIAYKDLTKTENGDHAGVYYNAISEDLFVWDNGDENDEGETRLNVRPSSLSSLHQSITEEDLANKLDPFKPSYDFRFTTHGDLEKGLDYISFFPPGTDTENMKISRGEERIFVWCFYLALFEVEGWADVQSDHFFIDDPVSSLDDHNVFITAVTLFDLIEAQFQTRKIILTTHHIGLFSILCDWLTKGREECEVQERDKSLHLDDTGRSAGAGKLPKQCLPVPSALTASVGGGEER